MPHANLVNILETDEMIEKVESRPLNEQTPEWNGALFSFGGVGIST